MIWLTALVGLAQSGKGVAIVGNVRVEFLSPTLVRVEEKGAEGFEDRQTFVVVSRRKSSIPFTLSEAKGRISGTWVRSRYASVLIPGRGESLTGTEVFPAGADKPVYRYDGVAPKAAYLPPPGRVRPYIMADSPRIVPPAWGATPAPDGAERPDTSGWDVSNDAPDIYVFLPQRGAKVTREFLDLTGHTELPPLWTFGRWMSWYHPYTEITALQTVQEFRRRHIPLDVFVIDTDWRKGASAGYAIETKYFPDMARFMRRAHRAGVRIVANDHPDPIVNQGLDPKELDIRQKGLDSLLSLGLDAWWYDRNWSTQLGEPAPGIAKEVWGMRLYHDMTQRFAPDRRPLIMTNAQGIDNGYLNYAPSPAAHRYPIWWTGDTLTQFRFLKWGIQHAVDWGAVAATPYLSEDLGGHNWHDTPELFTRYLEYGALSPVMRPHSTTLESRIPWNFGPKAEKITTDYTKLRYRLLPTIYAAARKNYDDGTPMLRRLDFEYPNLPGSADDTEYLFGDNLLVAPVYESVNPDDAMVPAKKSDFPEGLKAEYFANKDLEGDPVVTRTEEKLDWDWAGKSPVDGIPAENWSARWTGKLGPVASSGLYRLVADSDDGVRVYVDGKKVIDTWGPQAEKAVSANVKLEAGRTYDFKLEYLQLGGDALCHFGLEKAKPAKTFVSRKVIVPPGKWIDAWTGATVVGPQNLSVACPLWKTPMYVRGGGLIVAAPDSFRILNKPWSHFVVEAFPLASSAHNETGVYDDDRNSVAYQQGKFVKNVVSLDSSRAGATFRLSPPHGKFGAMARRRNWTVRFHLPAGVAATGATVDGRKVAFRSIASKGDGKAMPLRGVGTPDGPRAGVTVEVSFVESSRKAHAVKLNWKRVR